MNFKERFNSIKTSQLIIILIIIVVFIGAIVGIINYQNSQKLKKLPMLEIISPADGAIIADSQIVVTGETNLKNIVTINSKEIGVDKYGKFYQEIPLSIGDNKLIVIAKNSIGTENKKELKVTRKDEAIPDNSNFGSVGTENNVQIEQTPQVVEQTNQNTSSDGKGNLSTSGPESFWLLESAFLSAAGASWFATRKKLKNILKK